MSFSGGVFSINTTGQPTVAGTTISASVFNAFTSDIATGLSTCILKDGTQTATALVPFAAGISCATGTLQYPASTVVGRWTTPTFSAGNFTGNASMTWTVASGDVLTYEYTIMDKIMTVIFRIVTSTVGGTPDTDLQIAIPASKTAAKAALNPILANDNGSQAIAYAGVTASASVIFIQKVGAGAWAAATDATGVFGQITFEIN